MNLPASFILLATITSAFPQTTSPERSANLYGRITNAQTHDPIRRALIKIYTGKQQWNEISDANGRFKFPPPKRSEYDLAIHRDGYTERNYKIQPSDFDNSKELALELFPQAVISGRVVDGFGQPLEEAEISAFPAQQKNPQTPASTRTNDLGEYRLSGLDPGSYQIRATYREGRESEFDATPISRASAVKPGELTVKSGAIIEGIDFTLVPVRPVTVRGTVHTESGQPAGRATLWIEGPSPGREGSHNGQADNGKFEFADVSPGTYVISGQSDDQSGIYGSLSIDVRDEELNGVNLVLHPTAQIAGQIQARNADPSTLGKIQILFSPSDRANLIQSAKPDSSGSFQVGLHPSEYYVSISPVVASVEKITMDDAPVLNRRIKIDSSTKPHTLVIVVDPKSQP